MEAVDPLNYEALLHFLQVTLLCKQEDVSKGEQKPFGESFPGVTDQGCSKR